MEAKRNRVCALLEADISIRDITNIVPCSRSLVFKVKNLKNDGNGLQRKPGSGGHNKKRTEEFMADLEKKIEASLTTSMVKHGKMLGVSEKTIRNAVKDRGAISNVHRRRQLLSEASKVTRVTKGKKLLNWMKSNGSTVQIFSDKKLWTVDQARNRQNDRYLAYHVEDVPPINCSKHPASAMMLGVVASEGKKMPPYWFPKGLRISTEEYLDIMKNVVKSCLDANYPNGGYVWQQDSAPSHKSKKKYKNGVTKIWQDSGCGQCGLRPLQTAIPWTMASGA